MNRHKATSITAIIMQCNQKQNDANDDNVEIKAVCSMPMPPTFTITH